MPLSCDCYGGCWGDHSAGWPLIENRSMDPEELREIVRSVIPYGSYVMMPEGMRVERPEYVQLVHDRLSAEYFNEFLDFSIEQVTDNEVLECLDPLVGLTIEGVSTDLHARVCEVFPDPDERVSFIYLHMSDGSVLTFSCLGPAVFSYPSDPATALEDFAEIMRMELEDDGPEIGPTN